jgi:hypothetical protein
MPFWSSLMHSVLFLASESGQSRSVSPQSQIVYIVSMVTMFIVADNECLLLDASFTFWESYKVLIKFLPITYKHVCFFPSTSIIIKNRSCFIISSVWCMDTLGNKTLKSRYINMYIKILGYDISELQLEHAESFFILCWIATFRSTDER